MKFDLSSGTDIASHVLFDPAAVELFDGKRAPHREWEAWVRRQVEQGRALEYSDASDGELRIQLLVDEDFSNDYPYTRHHVLDGAILRVPSGELCFGGMEYMGRDTRAVPAHVLERARVPAGVYAVTAFEVNYDVTAERLTVDLDAQLQPGDRAYARRAESATQIGCLLILGALVLAAIVLFRQAPWSWKLWRAGIVFAAIGVVGGVLWRLHGSPRMTRWRRADEDMHRRHPHVVVILRSLGDGEIPEKPVVGRFGPAHLGEDGANEEQRVRAPDLD